MWTFILLLNISHKLRTLFYFLFLYKMANYSIIHMLSNSQTLRDLCLRCFIFPCLVDLNSKSLIKKERFTGKTNCSIIFYNENLPISSLAPYTNFMYICILKDLSH